MAEQYSISPADLRTIERNLSAITGRIDNVETRVQTVDSNVRTVYEEIQTLASEFQNYVLKAENQHNLSVAETRLIKIRQELETKYGHYGEVRRTITGILQADDLGIVKKETITNVTEEMMLSASGYWLAPCLVAIAAWINDVPDIANKALREAIKRDDEKTSLLFALVCRRAGRKNACLKWTKRYLENQDEENLDRKCIIMLDAFASGLLGVDSEGVVESQINLWLENLERKPGFVEQQTQQWKEAINAKRKELVNCDYTYLEKYSSTWLRLKEIMEGAMLHEELFTYLTNIFNQTVSSDAIRVQLDEIVTSLVSEFDDEELPLRKEETLNKFIIQFGGDLDRANQNMEVEKTAFERHKDFTQLLTDAAMKPESSHSSVSTQKLAFALSKNWVHESYQDVIADNRARIPGEVKIDIGGFHDQTVDGDNEGELIAKYHRYIDQEKAAALENIILTLFDKFCLYGGAVLVGLGFISLLGAPVLGILILCGGVGMILRHFSKKKVLDSQRESVESQFESQRESGVQIIRAVLAEVVDFRIDFNERDAQSEKVLDFIEILSAEQYVRRTDETNRRIRVNE